MEGHDRIVPYLDDFPFKERMEMLYLLTEQPKTPGEEWALKVAMHAVAAAGRCMAKRESDRRTDHKRRVLVGARVPRALAEKCRAAAEAEGLSLYAWVMRTLEQTFEK